MSEPLRAVVIGAGWAGEGHTRALQWCGVEVVAICARQPSVVRAVADRLGVAEASVDRRETIQRTKPDIVALATPATLRREVVEAAVTIPSHLFCDKPLALDAADAAAMYQLAEAAGVRHAYAATQRYGPEVAWLAELVRQGAVGPLHDVIGIFREGGWGGSGPSPWMWMADWRAGGGRLSNGFTHDLAILSSIIGGPPQRAMGRVRVAQRELVVVPDIHDVRQMRQAARTLTTEALAGLERRTAEAERQVTALVEFAGPLGTVPVALHAGPGIPPPSDIEGWRLYGENGTLLARRTGGRFSYVVSIVRDGAEEALPVPQRLRDELPAVGDDEQNKWCALARDVVADIRGQPHRPYLTFLDGWRYQVAIDAIRHGAGWTALPD